MPSGTQHILICAPGLGKVAHPLRASKAPPNITPFSIIPSLQGHVYPGCPHSGGGCMPPSRMGAGAAWLHEWPFPGLCLQSAAHTEGWESPNSQGHKPKPPQHTKDTHQKGPKARSSWRWRWGGGRKGGGGRQLVMKARRQARGSKRVRGFSLGDMKPDTGFRKRKVSTGLLPWRLPLPLRAAALSTSDTSVNQKLSCILTLELSGFEIEHLQVIS